LQEIFLTILFFVMGLVHTQVTLKNAGDVIKARDGFIKPSEVRQATITVLVDTGASTLFINEATRQKLGLKINGQRGTRVADGVRKMTNITEAVEIHWQDRQSVCSAVVLPDADEVLLGAIPLEDMDLVIHPATQQLVGAHGDEVVAYAM
jgi:clan AA aspartic protease